MLHLPTNRKLKGSLMVSHAHRSLLVP